MALTGKTIGQLTVSSGITQDSLFIIEQSGDTYSIPYSSMTSNSQGIQLLAKQEVSFNESSTPSGLYIFNNTTPQTPPDFIEGETFTNMSDPGSYATIVSYDGITLVVNNLVGSFNPGDTIQGDMSGTIFEINEPGVQGVYSFQTIILNNSNKCIIDSVYLTNRSEELESGTNCYIKIDNIYEDPSTNTNAFMFRFNNTNSFLNLNSDKFYKGLLTNNSELVQNQVYFMLTQQDINPVTADLYIYGYIIN